MVNPPQTIVERKLVELPAGITDGQALTYNAATGTVVATTVMPLATVAISGGGTGQTTATLACTAILPTATTNGTIAMWNGTAWAILAPGSIGDTLKINGSGVPAWTA